MCEEREKSEQEKRRNMEKREYGLWIFETNMRNKKKIVEGDKMRRTVRILTKKGGKGKK